jgi:hypothetical protein
MLRQIMIAGAALVGAVVLGAASSTPSAACAGGECSPTYCECERECSLQYDRFSPEWQACASNCPDQPPMACLCPEG